MVIELSPCRIVPRQTHTKINGSRGFLAVHIVNLVRADLHYIPTKNKKYYYY
jgi:hypothetical protein